MRPQFDHSSFRKGVEEDVSHAYKLISDLERFSLERQFDDVPEEEELAELELGELLTRIHERLSIALEFVDLPDARDRMAKRFAAHKNPSSLRHIPYVDVFFSPVLSELLMAYESFAACVGGAPSLTGTALEVKRDHQLLRQILVGTPKLIADRKLFPSNEAAVRREIFGLLLHVFPGTLREVPIPQVSKTYKADFGIPHLQTAIEYKFCDSAANFGTCLGGIYEDISGYAGSKDWSNFRAVIYCTDVFMTDAQLHEETQKVGMPTSWELLLVTGRGERKPRRESKVAPSATDQEDVD